MKLTRRTVMKQLGALGVAALTPRGAQGVEPNALDRFGGLKSVRFDASGYFRIERSDRWWFVTPEGNAFLSFGLNHPNEDYITQDYNVEFWKERFGVEDVSDPGFRAGFVRKVMNDLSKFGMNSLGTHSLKDRFGKLTVPYVQALFFVKTPYWMKPGKDKFLMSSLLSLSNNVIVLFAESSHRGKRIPICLGTLLQIARSLLMKTPMPTVKFPMEELNLICRRGRQFRLSFENH